MRISVSRGEPLILLYHAGIYYDVVSGLEYIGKIKTPTGWPHAPMHIRHSYFATHVPWAPIRMLSHTNLPLCPSFPHVPPIVLDAPSFSPRKPR